MPKVRRKKQKAAKVQSSKYKYSKYYANAAIDNDIIIYRSNRSVRVSANLLAVFEEIIKNKKYSNYKHIWLTSDKMSFENTSLKEYQKNERVSFIKSDSSKGMELLSKAKYIFYDNTMPMFFIKKEGQICVNLWAETPFRKMGLENGSNRTSQIWNVQKNFGFCDFLVTANSYTTEKVLEAYDLEGVFSGRIVESGSPRHSLMYNVDKDAVIEKISELSGINLKGKKIILYTPSVRRVDGKFIDSSKIIKNNITKLKKGLSDEYVLITRLGKTDQDSLAKKKIDILQAPSEIMEYELLAVADILIADYNNLFFDFIELGKKVIFFDYDREKSNIDRDAYILPEELPGPVCETVKEVLEAVADNDTDYTEKRKKIFDRYDGKEAERAVSAIFENKLYDYVIESSKKEKILLHTGVFNNVSDRELCLYILKQINYKKFTVIVDGNDIYSYRKEFSKISDGIKIINSRFEKNKSFFEKKHLKDLYKVKDDRYKSLFKMEFLSMYGGIKFNYIIDMVAKKTVWMNVFSAFECKNKSIITNNREGISEVLEEYTEYADDIIVVDGDKSLLKVNPRIRCIEREQLIGRKGVNPFNVLFISAFDSTNYVFVNLIKELTKKGHFCTVIVKDKYDAINNKMYIQEDIPFVEIDEFDLKLVSIMDFVFSAPLKYECYNALYKKINLLNKFVITFSSLFSSIVMGVNPDLSLSLGKSKFDEYRENGLKYNLVAVGNPQYDSLIELRRQGTKRDINNIKNVLMIEQGAYPFGKKGKQQIADVLCYMARKNPDITFTVKPRYIPTEKGKQLHVLSEHVYDFIEDKPDNLILLMEPVVLEDIITEFDAAITTWSTAYLDAAVLGLPLIMMEGFDSIDVYNVRNQRVNAAYDRLRQSGCVINFNEIYKLDKLPFKFADEKYLGEELYEPTEPCVPRVIELLELLYGKLIIPDKRWKTINQLEFKDFFDKFDEIPLIEVRSNEYKSRKKLFNDVNRILQKFIFENRCMGQVMDIENIYKMWDYEVTENTSRDDIKEAVGILNEETAKAREEFFKNHFDMVCQDRILQDYYFQWLFMQKKYHDILNYSDTLICPESLYFYRAVILYKKHRYKAGTKYMAQFFEISAGKECKDLRKDMSISAYLWKGRIGKYLILYYLDRYKAYDVIESIDKENVIYQKDIMLYFRVKSFVCRDMIEEAVALCDEYSRVMFKKTKSRNIKNRVKYFVGKIFYNKAEALVQKAEKQEKK